ncbi:serine hydrolase-like protein [Formica exsecta]|uniref:serine hydrolase-like protein n=1 Tax=Formica exsecta TaxID=72781 RepID=UPI001143A0B4|nr:serine hydrolase-like protein [Formica exsecta]XP_029661160.1 serine hydrolase-like protein [Formica exsecta]XP_029661161.1 serine hydrolase-like protein [Formica exsecta]XP_029661162.1 serine hydrolase-like protein [Formica exsecta]XP_029661163.1 serine hydrolase-like protein [Formica exsecta]
MAEIECKEIKLTVPWGYVAARTYGPSTGERVLLVHGHLDNAGSYNRLMKYLPIGFFYYVCVDLPGHGWSSHFPSWVMLDCMDYAHAIHFILEALQWKTCIYIGHSLGAQIGLIFSVFHPHRIKKIISFDGLIRGNNEFNKFVPYLENASALSIKASNNIEPIFYTREEVLYAFKTLRFAALNTEAADALFERAVTEVNGKYKYNRDIRLKKNPFMFISMDQAHEFNCRLSIPIYVFVPSKGFISKYEDVITSIEKTLNSKTILKVINIEGNHDCHNNDPKNVAPFVCKILTSRNSSKL